MCGYIIIDINTLLQFIYICDMLIYNLNCFAGTMCAQQPPVFRKTHTATQSVQLNINVGQFYFCTLL